MKSEESVQKFLEKARPTEVPFLYKYREMGSRGLERIFTDNEIYLSDPTKFNDPFDCKPLLTTYKSEVKKNQFYKGIVKERLPHLSKKEIKQAVKTNPRFRKLKTPKGLEAFLQTFLKGFGIYSLSEKPDDILMWSHYSESHKGICLEFKSTIENTIFWETYKVSYQLKYPTINIMDMSDIDQFYQLFCTKSDHWRYEQERRVIKTPNEGGAKVYVFEPDLLTGVILGAKISDVDAIKIQDLVGANKPKVKIYKAELDKMSYRININR